MSRAIIYQSVAIIYQSVAIIYQIGYSISIKIGCNMKKTIVIKLKSTEKQEIVLAETFELFNSSVNEYIDCGKSKRCRENCISGLPSRLKFYALQFGNSGNRRTLDAPIPYDNGGCSIKQNMVAITTAVRKTRGKREIYREYFTFDIVSGTNNLPGEEIVGSRHLFVDETGYYLALTARATIGDMLNLGTKSEPLYVTPRTQLPIPNRVAQVKETEQRATTEDLVNLIGGEESW